MKSPQTEFTKFGKMEIKDIIATIEQNTQQTIRLANQKIDKKEVKQLANALLKNYSITLFEISNTELTSKNIITLLESICRLPHLEKIYFQGIKLSDNDVQQIAERMPFFPKLQELNLADNRIQSNGATFIANALEKNNRITSLSLHTNQIGDEGVKVLAEMLKKNQTLQMLNLSYNCITDVGLQTLADALKTNKTLQQLYLGNNLITSKGAEAFAKILEDNQVLINLDVFGNKINDTIENQLLALVQRNKNQANAKRTERGHATIGDKFALLTEISRKEAQGLYLQEGIEVSYKLQENKVKMELGHGYFGKVRLARIIGGDQKFIGVKKIKGESKIAASKAEGKIHGQLSGKTNIMPFYALIDGLDSNGQKVLYLFMPLAGFGNGEKLKECLAHLQDAITRQRILLHVAKGLLTGSLNMHESHIYHLDIKPDNFVIDIRGEVYIIDFGCAIAGNKDNDLIRSNIGDHNYYSPERWLAEINAMEFDGAKADAWAIGVTLLEIVINYNPFVGADDVETYQDTIEKLQVLKDVSNDEYMALVKKLLVVEPNDRLSVKEALKLDVFKREEYQIKTPDERRKIFEELKQLAQPAQKKEKDTPISYINPASLQLRKNVSNNSEKKGDFNDPVSVMNEIKSETKGTTNLPHKRQPTYFNVDKSAAEPECSPASIPNDNNTDANIETNRHRFYSAQAEKNKTKLSSINHSAAKSFISQLQTKGIEIAFECEEASHQLMVHLHNQSNADTSVVVLESMRSLQNYLLPIIGLRNIDALHHENNALIIQLFADQFYESLRILSDAGFVFKADISQLKSIL